MMASHSWRISASTTPVTFAGKVKPSWPLPLTKIELISAWWRSTSGSNTTISDIWRFFSLGFNGSFNQRPIIIRSTSSWRCKLWHEWILRLLSCADIAQKRSFSKRLFSNASSSYHGVSCSSWSEPVSSCLLTACDTLAAVACWVDCSSSINTSFCKRLNKLTLFCSCCALSSKSILNSSLKPSLLSSPSLKISCHSTSASWYCSLPDKFASMAKVSRDCLPKRDSRLWP